MTRNIKLWYLALALAVFALSAGALACSLGDDDDDDDDDDISGLDDDGDDDDDDVSSDDDITTDDDDSSDDDEDVTAICEAAVGDWYEFCGTIDELSESDAIQGCIDGDYFCVAVAWNSLPEETSCDDFEDAINAECLGE
ncbi:MAG: hypothetical protein H6684_15450 [Deltaproteobacteria bacterium]|nr:hypothetical protein [bacterium]MCB9475723.1 hypothetical protein [Deltaproteobacteria bacterium]MCB9479245.1 hypothetical protein [Deltaproteobacteria bacterium]MCB9490125.1 hypothetical protein [Deltaproteobacteria bacterium]